MSGKYIVVLLFVRRFPVNTLIQSKIDRNRTYHLNPEMAHLYAVNFLNKKKVTTAKCISLVSRFQSSEYITIIP